MRPFSLVLLFTFLVCNPDPMSVVANATADLTVENQHHSTAITPNGQPALQLLSYNLWMIWHVLMPFGSQKRRAQGMLEHKTLFNDPHDVIVLQEAWDEDARDLLLKGLKEKGYSHQSAGNGGSDGVVIVSREPFLDSKNVLFNDWCGRDFFPKKGFVYAKIKVKNHPEPVHIIGTHLQADDTECSKGMSFQCTRHKQLDQIADFVQEKMNKGAIKDHEIVLYAGDFNIGRPINSPTTPNVNVIESKSDNAANVAENKSDNGRITMDKGQKKREEKAAKKKLEEEAKKQKKEAAEKKAQKEREEEYDDMLATLNAVPANEFVGLDYTYDSNKNDIIAYNWPGWRLENLDNVFMRETDAPNFDTVQNTTEVKTEEYKWGFPPIWGGKNKDLSDHFPIIYTIRPKNPLA